MGDIKYFVILYKKALLSFIGCPCEAIWLVLLKIKKKFSMLCFFVYNINSACVCDFDRKTVIIITF